jgi:hypothetical protein
MKLTSSYIDSKSFEIDLKSKLIPRDFISESRWWRGMRKWRTAMGRKKSYVLTQISQCRGSEQWIEKLLTSMGINNPAP